LKSWTSDLSRYQDLARQIEPAIRLTTKAGWFWRALAPVVHVCTFGGTTRKAFLEKYGTTIGPVVASPRSWPRLNEGYLVHEVTHAADMRKAGLGIHPWVGLLLYGLAYLALPFPIGFAWCRYRLELRADKAAWRHELAHGLRGPEGIIERAKERGEALRGGAYGYAWLWARGGYLKAAQAVLKESGYVPK
jgi:hypothetical protein